MTTFTPGQHVRCFRDFGTVKRVIANGFAYRVTFPGIGEVTCLANALTEAPSNVTPFVTLGGERINCVKPVEVVTSSGREGL